MNKTVIIDYGMGNLNSVKKACTAAKIDAVISADISDINTAEKLILPGVGAFNDAMNKLRSSGLDKAIVERVNAGIPLLGICLGMQLLFDYGREGADENISGLGLIEGHIKKFDIDLNVPEIGWNSIEFKADPIFDGIKNDEYMYFAHSYYVECKSEFALSVTEYGINYPSTVRRGNVYGMQFHPEKSGDAGIKLLSNFGKI